MDDQRAELKPQPDQIEKFLCLITRRWTEIGIETDFEIRLLGGGGVQPRRFALSEIATAAKWAAFGNEDGLNAYVVINPIARTHVGSAQSSAIAGATYVFVDADTPEAMERLRASGVEPTIEVVTGTSPHQRVHWYFELSGWITDISEWCALMELAICGLGTDQAVKDAPRMMRLPGTIAWPNDKKKARGYMPELTTFNSRDRAYDALELTGRLEALRPAAAITGPPTDAVAAQPAEANAVAKAAPSCCASFDELSDALLSIPNDAQFDHWSAWNKVAMAWWSATAGTEAAFTVLDEWSMSHPSYDRGETRKRWDQISRSPPTKLSASTIFYLARQAGWRGPRYAEGVQSDSATTNGAINSARSQVDTLIELTSELDLFITSAGAAYADIEVDGHRATWMVRGDQFRRWIIDRYFKETGRAPGTEALATGIATVEARAHSVGCERTVHHRVAYADDRIYLDLGDKAWRTIEISRDGWHLLDDAPPVRFLHPPGIRPLPTPARGGSVAQLRRFLNVKSDADFVLAVSWLVYCLQGQGPYPVLVLAGEQGSAKSTASAFLRTLVDPRVPALRALPRDQADLMIAADNAFVLAFDNLSRIPDGTSDDLCRLATGGGFATRQLYTNREEALFEAVRPVILNGIDDVVARSDLADRSLLLTLEPIPDDKRRTEADLRREFEAAAPSILGALLDALVEGLRRRPHIHFPALPRMADFASWAAACETAYAPEGTFWSAYTGNRERAVEEIIDGDPVAAGVREIAQAGGWTGTATELLQRLEIGVDDRVRRSKEWPQGARALSARLTRASTFLRAVGVEIGRAREGRSRTRTIVINKTNRPVAAELPELASTSSAPSAGPSNSTGEASGAAVARTVEDGQPACLGPIVRADPNNVGDETAADGADARSGEPQEHRPQTKVIRI